MWGRASLSYTPHVESGAFREAVADLGPALLRALAGLEHAARQLHPPRLAALAETLRPVETNLRETREPLAACTAPSGLEAFSTQLCEASRQALDALTDLTAPGGDIRRVLRALHRHHRAEAALFPLRHALPPVGTFFLEPAAAQRRETLDPDPPAPDSGIHQAANGPEQRGGFALYVPETVRADEPLPLIVALHGGSGHGGDFLWSWLREARSRRCLLLAPTSQRSTWSLMGEDVDTPQLHRMIDFVAERWPLDRERVLLTGLSDGATFSLLTGLSEDSPFRAIAPLSGVLHPANFHNGNLSRARGRRVYLVHGALDWMFPIETARLAAQQLTEAGVELQFEEVADLSHTYAREQNARILDWFGCPISGAAG